MGVNCSVVGFTADDCEPHSPIETGLNAESCPQRWHRIANHINTAIDVKLLQESEEWIGLLVGGLDCQKRLFTWLRVRARLGVSDDDMRCSFYGRVVCRLYLKNTSLHRLHSVSKEYRKSFGSQTLIATTDRNQLWLLLFACNRLLVSQDLYRITPQIDRSVSFNSI